MEQPGPTDGGEDVPNGAGGRAPPAPVEVVVEEEAGEDEEEPPRSATAKQEEAKAALGAEGSRPFTMRELLGEIKEDNEAADGSGGGAVGSVLPEGDGTGSADVEGSSSSSAVFHYLSGRVQKAS